MPLHDQIVDTNKRPVAESKKCWTYDSSTFGDMHAHAEGLLWRTAFEGIITTAVKDTHDINGTLYAELAHISSEYYHYTEQLGQYGHPYVQIPCNKEPTDEDINKQFKEKRKAKESTSIIYTWKNAYDKLFYKVRIPPKGEFFTLPDNEGKSSIKEIMATAIEQGHIPPLPKNGLNESALEPWRTRCASINSRLKHAKLRFDKILSKVKLADDLPDDFLLYLIGDALSDRGPSDELMFKVFQKLQKLAIEQLKERLKRLIKTQSMEPSEERAKKLATSISTIKQKLKAQTLRFFKINLSNHDTSFLKWYLKFQNTGDYSFSTNISAQQTTSLKNLCLQIEQGLITKQELKQWVEEDYLPHIELFSFSEGYNKAGEEVSIIRTHAPSPQSMYDTINEMKIHLNVNFDDTRLINDRERIDTINQTFQKTLKERDSKNKMIGLQRYIDDYEYQEWVGNIQTIAHILDDIRSGRKDANISLLFKTAIEIESIEHNAKNSKSAAYNKINHSSSPEKKFLEVFREKYNETYIQPYIEAQDAKEKKAMTDLEDDLLFILKPITDDRPPSTYEESASLEIETVLNRETRTPCPYYWITNNRWIPQEPFKDTLAHGTHASRRYGHVGENRKDDCNLDTPFFQGNQNNKTTKNNKKNQFYRSDRLCTLKQHLQYYEYLVKQIDIIDKDPLLVVNPDLQKECNQALDEKNKIGLLKSATIVPNITRLEEKVNYLTREMANRRLNNGTPPIIPDRQVPYIRLDITINLAHDNKAYLEECKALHKILQKTVTNFLEKEAKLNNAKNLFKKRPGQSKKITALDKISDNLWEKEIQLRKHIAEIEAAITKSKDKKQNASKKPIIHPLDFKKMADESVQLLDENKSFLQKNKNLFDVPRKALCWFLSHALCMFSDKTPSQQKYNSYAVLFHKAGETHANLVRQEAKKALLDKMPSWKGLSGLLDNVGEKDKQKANDTATDQSTNSTKTNQNTPVN